MCEDVCLLAEGVGGVVVTVEKASVMWDTKMLTSDPPVVPVL